MLSCCSRLDTRLTGSHCNPLMEAMPLDLGSVGTRQEGTILEK